MTIWRPRKDDIVRPAYRSLARLMAEAIDTGKLEPGARLPTHRALAFDLGLSLQTVSRAYDELTRLGLIVGEVGRGSFVRGPQRDAQMPWHRLPGGDGVIDFSMLVPVTGEIHVRRMSETLAELSGDLPLNTIFSFRPRATLERHVAHASTWIASGGVDAHPARIVPTNGNTSAMSLALQTVTVPGDLVVTEELGHHTLTSLTSVLGLRLHGLAIDEEGIVPDAFEAACRAEQVKALYLMPTGLGPTCAVMGEARRAEIIEIADRHQVWIIENDAWGPIEPDRPPSFATLAPERTLYFTGLSKCLVPGLRIGWLVVPDTLITTARTRHLVTNWMATPLISEIASRWIADGTAANLLGWQRKKLALRNRIVRERLSGFAFRSMPHGLHVWLPLPGTWNEQAFVEHARGEGVAVAGAVNFRTGPHTPPAAIRICLGAGTEKELAQGIGTIARLLRSIPEPALLAI